MTTSHELSPYTGDPHHVFLAAIDAKVAGRLTEEEFKLVITGAHSIPTQRVTAHPISTSASLHDETIATRQWRVMGITIHNPVVLGIALILIAAVAITLMGIVVIGLVGAITWAKANAAMIGGTVILVIILGCVVLGMLARMKNAQAEASHARAARYAYQHPREQRPVYVNADSDSKEMS